MSDVIIIGSDVSSLMAALILLKRRKRVALFRTPRFQDSPKAPGYLFPIDSLPWTGLYEGGLLYRILHEFEIPIPQDDHDSSLQVVFPDRRIDLSEGMPPSARGGIPTDLLRAAQRNGVRLNDHMGRFPFPGADTHNGAGTGQVLLRGDMLLKRLRCAADVSFINTRTASNGVVPALNRLLSSRADDRPVNSMMLFHFLHAASRGLASSSAKGSVTEGLLERCRSLGGTFHDIATISDLSIGRRISIAFEGSDATSRIEAENLIMSVKWKGFRSVLEDDLRFSHLRRTMETVSIGTYPFTIHLGVDEDAFPERMSDHVVLCDDSETSYVNRGLYYLERSRAGDDESAPSGTCGLAVTSFLYHSPRFLNYTYLERFCRETVRRIGWFLPFLDEQTRFRDALFSIDMSRDCLEMVNMKYDVRKDTFSDIHSLSPYMTPLANVFITGGMLLPGLGFDGEIISGLNAARCLKGVPL